MRLLLLLLLASGAARAWDPTDAASVETRIEALKADWAGKDAAAVANDKLKRARQGVKPAWVSRPAFRIDDGPRRIYLGVGSAKLPAAAAKTLAVQDALAPPAGATPLDWYLDEATGTLYALTVEERR
jgi:malate synthase